MAVIENRYAAFHCAYEKLADEDRCDAPGGMEYHRVRGEWIGAGCPDSVEDFIVWRANLGPDCTADQQHPACRANQTLIQKLRRKLKNLIRQWLPR